MRMHISEKPESSVYEPVVRSLYPFGREMTKATRAEKECKPCLQLTHLDSRLDYSQVADQITNRRLFFFVSTFKLERSQSIDAIIDYLFMVNISKRID